MSEKVDDQFHSQNPIFLTSKGDESSSTEEEKKENAEKKPAPPIESVSFKELFRFATFSDKILMTVACFCGMGSGVMMPLFSFILGRLFSATNSPYEFERNINTLCLYMLLVALATGVLSYLQATLASVSAERQVRRIREQYFTAIMRQDRTWYDTGSPGEVASRLAADTLLISNGLGQKVSMTVYCLSTFFAGFIMAFVSSWALSLVVIGFVPILGIVGGVMQKYIGTNTIEGGDGYAKAGAAATETLTNIRTVAANGGEVSELKRYLKFLRIAEKADIRQGTMGGVSVGVFLGVMFLSYGVAMLFGAKLVLWSREKHPECVVDPYLDYCFTGGDVITCFFALLMGAGTLGQVGPAIADITSARAAAFRIFGVIDRVPAVDVFPPPIVAEKLLKPEKPLTGKIEFRNITFAYPSRPDQLILDNFSLIIEPGTTVAFVGHSGCGKSTLIALVQRLYDPLSGSVLIDDVDIREYDVQWLRNQLSIVAQEPALLSRTVAENIALGKPGTPASMDEVQAAATVANAHAFISSLPQGYDTPIKTSVMSGGQKQRIAIARAIIRNAPILLLDEATSALDTHSERVVQRALDNLLSDNNNRRTSIVIAHRLSTLANADRIVVFSHGKIIEDDSPTLLLSNPNSVYKAMFEAQRAGQGSGDVMVSATSEIANPDDDPSLPAILREMSVEDIELNDNSEEARIQAAVVKNPLSSTDNKPSDELTANTNASEQAKVPFSRIIQYNRPEILYAVLGIFCSGVSGAVFPVFAIILSKFTAVYYEPNDDDLWQGALEFFGWFMLIMAASFLGTLFHMWSFSVLGARLVRRIRAHAYSSLLRAEIAFFDRPGNSTGAITARLAADAALLKSVTGTNIAINTQNVFSLIIGLVIAFTASWRLTLVILCAGPVMVIAGKYQADFAFTNTSDANSKFAACGDIAEEAISNVSTVSAFGLQKSVLSRFRAALEPPSRANMRTAILSGLGLAISQFSMFSVYALAFYAGAKFMSKGWMNFEELLTSFFAVAMAAMGLGNSQNLVTDAAKADTAARNLFALIDRPSDIDPLMNVDVHALIFEDDANRIAADKVKAVVPAKQETSLIEKNKSLALPIGANIESIEFRNVTFSYPSRPDQVILKNVSITIEPGTTVAIVGPSGSGKSSLLALLERFYDPNSGTVLINGVPLNSYDPATIRSNIAWVQQEAPLFADSIAYSIAYGAARLEDKLPPGLGVSPDGTVSTSNNYKIPEAVQNAAKAANAYDFIMEFKHGFNTYAGTGGAQLSGGQKQRVAIARAVMRNAPILLLDEATAALDSQNEIIVQESIQRILDDKDSDPNRGHVVVGMAPKNGRRTALIVAHRLSTLRNVDRVIVLKDGQVAEDGPPNVLLAKRNGLYRAMVDEQNAGLDAPSSSPR